MGRRLALLGSINVGGNRITMADLVGALTKHGFADVETVVASGNILFDPPTGVLGKELPDRIADIVRSELGVDTFALVLSAAELEAAIAENPFSGTGEDKFVHVHFLTAQPGPERFERLLADHAGRGDERIAPGTRALHIDYVNGVGTSKLTAAFIERRLGCQGTARNMRSLKRLTERLA